MTLREHLEAIRRELVNPNNHEHLRLHVMEHAERALEIIDNADIFRIRSGKAPGDIVTMLVEGSTARIIPDDKETE